MDDELARRIEVLCGKHVSLNGWICEALEGRASWLEKKRAAKGGEFLGKPATPAGVLGEGYIMPGMERREIDYSDEYRQ